MARLSPSEGSRGRAARPGISQRPALRWHLGCDETIHARQHVPPPPRSDGLGARPKDGGAMAARRHRRGRIQGKCRPDDRPTTARMAAGDAAEQPSEQGGAGGAPADLKPPSPTSRARPSFGRSTVGIALEKLADDGRSAACNSRSRRGRFPTQRGAGRHRPDRFLAPHAVMACVLYTRCHGPALGRTSR
jgi:hypothetical protein